MSQDCIDSAAASNPEEFSGYFHRKRLKCKEEDRMETFRNSWCNQKRPTSQEMVNAGFYYKKYDDRVCCFLLWRSIISMESLRQPMVRACKMVSFV